ncbi:MAG: hypothetical protein R3C02_15335 [Planctomycetaceae bacterium]
MSAEQKTTCENVLIQPISLTTLCMHTHTSERSLRRAFHDVLGVSPINPLSPLFGFQSRTAYEAAVVKAVSEASEVREAVEKLMSQLSSLVRRPDDDVEQAAAAYSATSNG